ncbi:MAG: indole-3-glycerol phosphate synthase TrpC [Kiritimatiellae bacterium]|nr:indole-3-glycerol phosphate synthase TrpC [Kiritimatiellia bacterium]
MSVLERILADKRAEIARRRRGGSPPPPTQPPPPFAAALRSVPIGLIAEVKRRSPSAGVIREPWDPAAIALAYAAAGAQAISVLVDEPYFGGGEADFRAVRSNVPLPLLYKEFVLDEWQVAHAASLGASAVLLIVAALDDVALKDLSAASAAYGLETLVEVHNERELERALAAGATLIGINNRDLRTFRTDLTVSLRLAPAVPRGTTLVSESGIRDAEDVRRLQSAGVHAILVGESLLRQSDVAAAVRRLMAPARGGEVPGDGSTYGPKMD